VARLRESQDDFVALIAAASEATGLPLEFVEKDYWVTEVLRAVSVPVRDGHVVFKGGTSLSKAYGLIRRFSEDVDILVVPDARLGQNRRNDLLKELCRNAQAHLQLGDDACEIEARGKGQHRSVRFMHDLVNVPVAVRRGTLLQLGMRGGDEPHQTMELASYVAEEARAQGAGDDFEEFAPLEIRVLRPERTLVEKLYAVHDFCSDLPRSRAALIAGARHYYDIGHLLRDADVLSSLRGKDFDLATLVEAVREVSHGYGGGAPLTRGGFAASPAFDASSDAFTELRPAYERVADLVVGPLLPLDDVVSLVHEHRALLDPDR
jgi:hypothetical protein